MSCNKPPTTYAQQLGVIEPMAAWPKRLMQHVLTLRSDLLPHMGFPADWRQRPLWKQRLAQ